MGLIELRNVAIYCQINEENKEFAEGKNAKMATLLWGLIPIYQVKFWMGTLTREAKGTGQISQPLLKPDLARVPRFD